MMKRALCLGFLAVFPILGAAQSSAPELIIHHGKIFTADTTHRWAEAVAIRGNRIVAVGTNREILAMAGDRTKGIDAANHIVVPGFNDAHTHQGPHPEAFTVSTDPDSSWTLVGAALAGAADETPGDMWIYGTIGPQILADPKATADALDKLSGGRKVVLASFTGHGKILSGAAMRALHIRGNESDPAGGWYERDANHNLTGKMFEYAGWSAERKIADSVSDSDAIDQLKAFSDEATHFGVTSIQNMSMQSLAKYEKVERHGPAAIRIRMIRIPINDSATRESTEGATIPVTTRERPLTVINGTKWILDGTPVEGGAALRRPYPGGENSGKLNFPPDEIKTILKEAMESKEPTLLHVVGDRTAAAVFDEMRAVAPAEEWRKKRLRFEHADGLHPDLIALAKEFGIVAVLNPLHAPARSAYPPGPYMPVRSLLKAGVPIAIGSDGPINPGLNIQFATTMPGNAGEALSREEAVEAYTRGSAYAELMEVEKGTITVGKLADLAVLSQDIFTVPAEQLPATTSILTVIDGVIVYDAGVSKETRGIPTGL